MKKLLYLLLVVPFAFSSCKKEETCENCGAAIELLYDSETLAASDSMYQALGYNDTKDYWEQALLADATDEELCGDELDDAKAGNGEYEDVIVPGMYRIYIDCN